MRRKTIIVLVITLMVTVLVSAFSYLYISQILRLRIVSAYETATSLTHQLAYAAGNAVPDFSSTSVDTSDPAALRRALADYVQTDVSLNNLLQSIPGDWRYIYYVAVVDTTGKALLHTNAALVGKMAPPHPDFEQILRARFREQIRLVFSPAAVYDVSYPLELNGAPFGTIRIGVQTVFLKSEVQARLMRSLYISIALIFVSLFLAAGISNLALGPLKEISRNLDSVSAGESQSIAGDESQHDEYGLVTLKIANLGRQIRDSREIFTALKDNVDQLMSKLQDGLMLFDRDSRVVLVSAPLEGFLNRPRRELLGRTVQELFDRKSMFGSALLNAFERKRPISQREFETTSGKRVQLSLDFVQEQTSQIGALLIMRDAESVRRIGDEIEMSRRLSASGRLTRGVAHEVKNPINAIVLHLQLLQNKLAQQEPDTRRHVDIIDSEIRRLDRVIQTLVDFTRPRDLHLEEMDLRRLLDDVALLAGPDAEQHGVTIERHMDESPLPVKVDSDLMKQAFLNVVINGVQAMPNGGLLTISAHRDNDVIIVEVQDQGAGIPKELHDKVFELYFTTKTEGSGIGLAQTYQILQWHYGSVDFQSAETTGTIFRFQIPAMGPLPQGNSEYEADTAASHRGD
ncbi:MAG: PAS domain-containing sensor histidine kinase [Acidobacteria bacterium]|jgi:signal transduction histidine kinase|nr:MAG: PAS domain-containing sensor histidine kinase [Acidobacteriota bacterium]